MAKRTPFKAKIRDEYYADEDGEVEIPIDSTVTVEVMDCPYEGMASCTWIDPSGKSWEIEVEIDDLDF
jgi:hypothetical protein